MAIQISEKGWDSVSRKWVASMGLNLLAAYWVMWILARSNGMSFSNIFQACILVTALAMLLAASLLPSRRKEHLLSAPGIILLSALGFWWSVVVVRGISTDQMRLFTWLANPQVGSLGWFLPALALLGARAATFDALQAVFYRHALLGIVLSLLVIALYLVAPTSTFFLSTDLTAFHAPLFLFYAVPLLVLMDWRSRQKHLILRGCLLLMIILSFLAGIRTYIILYFAILLYCMVLGRTSSFLGLIFKSIIFASAAAVLLSWAVVAADGTIGEDWYTDTRSFLVDELFADLNILEVLIGRGALGVYFSPYFEHTTLYLNLPGDSPDRQLSEIGYLHLILKAGSIGVCLYLTVAAGALASLMAKGSLSRRDFSFAAFVVIQLCLMSVWGNTFATLHNALYWMIIGAMFARQPHGRVAAGHRAVNAVRSVV